MGLSGSVSFLQLIGQMSVNEENEYLIERKEKQFIIPQIIVVVLKYASVFL